MLAALALLLVTQSPAAPPEVPPWSVSAAMEAASSAAFDDAMALGAAATVWRRVADAQFYLGGRITWTRVAEANTGFSLTHDQLSAELVGGRDAWFGIGRLFLEIGIGATSVVESRRRHQYERLESLGLDSQTRRSYSLGPSLLFTGGAAVRFFDNLSVIVAGGPRASVLEVADMTTTRLGWHVSLGLGYAM